MARPRKLSRPPIAEALVDLRIAGANPTVEELEALADSIRDEFPKKERQETAQVRFETREGQGFAEARDLGVRGFILQSPTNDRRVQFRLDGFTFNRLPPYQSAEEMIAEALHLWDAYCNVVHPTTVTRIALRYINKLDLPFREGDNFDRLLEASPRLPAAIPQQVIEFRTRVAIADVRRDAVAFVTQRLDQGQGTNPYIIDVDVFKAGQFPADSESLRSILLDLRDLKNDLFFSHLTEEAVRLYE